MQQQDKINSRSNFTNGRKLQFGWPFDQSNFQVYTMHWLHTLEFQLPPLATRSKLHCLRPFPGSWHKKVHVCSTAQLH